jgi:putative membrane protein insertion efficiency factor
MQVAATIWRGIWNAPAALLIRMVRLYQFFLSPIMGGHCRFEPSCSAYFIEAVRKYGAVIGAAKGIWRICRCHPFCQGGYDPP